MSPVPPKDLCFLKITSSINYCLTWLSPREGERVHRSAWWRWRGRAFDLHSDSCSSASLSAAGSWRSRVEHFYCFYHQLFRGKHVCLMCTPTVPSRMTRSVCGWTFLTTENIIQPLTADGFSSASPNDHTKNKMRHLFIFLSRLDL